MGMEYASPEEQAALTEEVEKAEEWSYEHIEEEASVYEDRLKKLKSHEDKFSSRKANLEASEEKVKALKNCIKRFKASAIAPVYDHIAKEKLDQLRADCDAATEWLAEREKKLADQKKWEDSAFNVTELNVRTST